MSSHSSSPALLQGNHPKAANSHSPYHVLAQITSALSESTNKLTATHAEFVKVQKSIYKTGAEVSGLLSSVKTGIQVEELGLDNVGDSWKEYRKFDKPVTTNEPTKQPPRSNPTSSSNQSGNKERKPRVAENIYKANATGTNSGINESDPIIID
jgi:hypothetical protein